MPNIAAAPPAPDAPSPAQPLDDPFRPVGAPPAPDAAVAPAGDDQTLPRQAPPAPDAAVFGPPVLASLDPATAAVGAPDLTLRCLGSGFRAGSAIVFNGGFERTTLVGPTEVTTIVEPSTASGPATVPVAVANPDGRRSAELPFAFTAAQAPPPPEPPEEPEVEGLEAPTDVSVSGLSATGATITWTTQTPNRGRVEYGTDEALGSTTPQEAANTTTHSRTLSGLTAATDYSFSAGTATASATGTFTTPAA